MARHINSWRKPKDLESNLAEYKTKLEGLTEDEFLAEAEQMIWLSAYASNNLRSDYHWQCDANYDEAVRREKPELYQKAWSLAARGTC